jgi:uncharacterized protein
VLTARLIGFASFLRRNGFVIGLDDSRLFLDAASRVGVLDAQLLRWTGRAVLCRRAEDRHRYDELFDGWFMPPNRQKLFVSSTGGGMRGLEKGKQHAAAVANDSSEGMPAFCDSSDDASNSDGSTTQRGASAAENLATVDFKHLHRPEEMRALDALMRRFASRLHKLITRRECRGGALRIDFPGTARRSVSHGGEPIELAFRQRRSISPRLVLLLDVSRSMNLYSFFFLRLARALQGAHLNTQVFIWHTHLSGVSEALRDPDPWRAQERLQLLSAGWAGGTRIGECLRQFEREHARIVDKHTALIIVSDGFDTGEPQSLSEAMCLLRRRARRIVWLNPLAGRHSYLPLARGMQAALPHVDVFAPAHDLASIERVLPHLLLAIR